MSDKPRGKIQGFSKASRLRLLEQVNSVDRSKVGERWFLGLTIPAEDNSWDLIEPRRRAYVRKLQEQWGTTGWFAYWKKEPHPKAGPNHLKPHLHLMLYWLKGHPVPSLQEFRAWNDQAWADVVKARDPEKHKRVGCRVERMHSWNGVAYYVGKYFAKQLVDSSTGGTGRIWGHINGEVAPTDIQEQTLSPEVGKRMRRILRKLQERKRRYWLARIEGKWEQVRKVTRIPCGSEDPILLSPDEHAAWLASHGHKLKLIRPKVIRTKEVQIWAQEEESYKLLPVQVHGEDHSYCSSLHFCQSSTVLRLVELLERQYTLPPPPDDGIPF